jgi:hypothetical protein
MSNFQDTVLERVELIISVCGCAVPPLETPVSNFNDRLLELLDALIACLGAGGSAYAPQHYAGDPNGHLTARTNFDLAIDTVNSELYYSAIADSTVWIVLCPGGVEGGS